MPAAKLADSGRSGSAHDRILSVAKTLFAQKGYDNASTAAIARIAGSSESQVMKHFESKQGLLEAIFNQGWNQITNEASAAIAQIPSPAEKLAILGRIALTVLERDQELKKLYLLEGRRMRRDGSGVSVTEGFLAWLRVIDGVLYELQVMGALQPGIHPQAARSALVGMMEGLLRDHALGQSTNFPAAYQLTDLPMILGLVVRSFLAPPPRP